MENENIEFIETQSAETESVPESTEAESESSGEEILDGTVSNGDSTGSEQVEAGIASDIVEVVLSAEQNELFEKNNELLTQLIELETQTVIDKPLAQYTPTEGMLLIILVFVVGLVLGRIIGGIIPCKQ